ncbi:MAG TPA: hypothetical protein VH085_07265, partial [Nocardioides sp.]|nr:hypothetical protein [Nocardioides sp.]
MRMDVDTSAYASASQRFSWGNHAVVEAVTGTSVTIDGGGGMAGADVGGAAFARQYDAAAWPLLRAGADLGESMGGLAHLLDASLANHEGADFAARIAGPLAAEGHPGGSGDGAPDVRTETLLAPKPPSAAGGTGEVPAWWHWVSAHLQGLLWPDADTGRLRTVGQAWIGGAGDLESSATYAQDAATELGVVFSPEVHDARTTCHDVAQRAVSLGGAYRQIGQACVDYADAVDDHRHQVEDAVADFIKWTILIEGAGVLLSEVGGELVAQGAEAARIANAAQRIVGILKPLVELAEALASRLFELVRLAASVLERLKAILGARVVRATEEAAQEVDRQVAQLVAQQVAQQVARSEKDALIAELGAAGVRHDPKGIVTIFRDADGRIVWLERG